MRSSVRQGQLPFPHPCPCLSSSPLLPSRHEYDDDDLGSKYFRIGKGEYLRRDYEVKNGKGQTLKCSRYKGLEHRKKMPCVIYLHGNAGSRLDASCESEIATLLLPMGVSLVAFDFAGSGHSEGDYVSLGYFERDDLTAVVADLLQQGDVTRIGLWGRSMGGATALMFAARDPSITW